MAENYYQNIILRLKIDRDDPDQLCYTLKLTGSWSIKSREWRDALSSLPTSASQRVGLSFPPIAFKGRPYRSF
jgi:hypothetical protein